MHQMIHKPLDRIERDIQREFGHWSHHIGNEVPAAVKYANQKVSQVEANNKAIFSARSQSMALD